MIAGSFGMLILAVFLLCFALLGLTGAAVPFLLPILALIAGIALLIGK